MVINTIKTDVRSEDVCEHRLISISKFEQERCKAIVKCEKCEKYFDQVDSEENLMTPLSFEIHVLI